jgi:hypothetical protein
VHYTEYQLAVGLLFAQSVITHNCSTFTPVDISFQHEEEQMK